MGASIEEIATQIVGAGAIEVRDVDNGEEPFVYSSGNRGPGYIMIKGLVGQRKVLKFLTRELAKKVAPLYGNAFDFVDGNATGGMIPAYDLTDRIEEELKLEPGTIPYNYLRGTRKAGGHGELITGNRNNKLQYEGMKCLVMEELVNFAETTRNAAEIYRNEGYPVTHAACLLTYDHEASNQRLKDAGIELVYVITLPELLDGAESGKLIPQSAIESQRAFLSDTIEWQLSRGYIIPEKAAEMAVEKGYKMRKLDFQESLQLGAPESKLKTPDNEEGFTYFAREE